MTIITLLAVACVLLVVLNMASSQDPPPANYDESKIPPYTLPDPLMLLDGRPVRDPQAWRQQRRTELLELFREHVYGHSPGRPQKLHVTVQNEDQNALDGKAIRREVRIAFVEGRDEPSMDVMIHLPKNAAGPVPVFLGLSFYGNHTAHPDPGIALNPRWMRHTGKGVVDNRATEDARGTSARNWCVEDVIARGYGHATLYYGDIALDDPAPCFKSGVFTLIDHAPTGAIPGLQPRNASNQWGAISAWAWGLSRVMDYLETDPAVDAGRVAVMGHSRLGKTALWAAAQDERFALSISNNSGCGGAALSRRRIGETVHRINWAFPHWFCENFRKFNGREDDLPVDQHMLIALIAPRPVMVCSAEEDQWADPRGEFLAAAAADPVYRLLTNEGLDTKEMPPVNQAVLSRIGYRIRDGGHGVRPDDWAAFLDFADRNLVSR